MLIVQRAKMALLKPDQYTPEKELQVKQYIIELWATTLIIDRFNDILEHQRLALLNMSNFIRPNKFPLNPETQTTAGQETQATAGQETQKRTETTAIISAPANLSKPLMSTQKK